MDDVQSRGFEDDIVLTPVIVQYLEEAAVASRVRILDLMAKQLKVKRAGKDPRLLGADDWPATALMLYRVLSKIN